MPLIFCDRISYNDITWSKVKKKKKKEMILWLSFGIADGFISRTAEFLVGKLILMGSDIGILAMKTIPYYTVMFYDS